MARAISVFSSLPWTVQDIDLTLHSAFQVAPDPLAGWRVIAAPGREVIVEDGTDDLPTMPPDIVGRAAWLLEAPVVRRLSLMFNDDPNTIMIDTERNIYQYEPRNDPNLEWNTALWIGAVLARHVPVAMDDHAGYGWRQPPA